MDLSDEKDYIKFCRDVPFENIAILDCDNIQNIPNLTELFTHSFEKLRVINLFNKSITELTLIKTPNTLPKLRLIILKNNLLRDTGDLALLFTPFLNFLNLSNNRIENCIIPLYPNLTELYLSNNPIKNIPLLNLPKLRLLDMNSCKIRSLIDFRKCDLPKLESLYLSNNNITDVSALAFLNSENIFEIDLSNNLHLEDVSAIFRKFTPYVFVSGTDVTSPEEYEDYIIFEENDERGEKREKWNEELTQEEEEEKEEEKLMSIPYDILPTFESLKI